MQTKELLSLALTAAIDAGKEIMRIYATEDFGVDFKGDNSPLTKADLASHDIIVAQLEKTDIPILSEEGKDLPYSERKAWRELWIVDPIDGTKEFIKRNGEFTVNIALVENNTPILGVVYAPAIDKLYFASSGVAYVLHVDLGAPTKEVLQQISTATQLPKKNVLDKYTVVASKSHLSPETEVYIDKLKKEHGEVELISKGSSLKLCLVAEGLANCYPRFAPTMEWDTAAGDAICRNAGFTVLDWKTKEKMQYNRENLLNNWFLVEK